MRTSKFTDSQIMAVLKQAEGGTPVPALCREHNISSATFYKWRARFGGMDVSMMARLNELVGATIAKAMPMCMAVAALRSGELFLRRAARGRALVHPAALADDRRGLRCELVGRRGRRLVLDLALAAFAILPVHTDDGGGHAVRLHLTKEQIVRATGDRRGDLDALRVCIRLPGIVLLRRIKHMPDELATIPRKLRDVFPGKKHHTSLIRQRLRQDEACAMRHDGRV